MARNRATPDPINRDQRKFVANKKATRARRTNRDSKSRVDFLREGTRTPQEGRRAYSGSFVLNRVHRLSRRHA